MVRKILLTFFVLLFLVFSWREFRILLSQNTTTTQNEEVLEAKVEKILEEKKSQFDNRDFISQKLQMRVTKGSIVGKDITVTNMYTSQYDSSKFQKGDTLLVGYLKGSGSNDNFYIISYARTTPLMLLFALFIVLTLGIARKKGLYSLIGMTLSLIILTVFLLPRITSGANPFYTTLIGMISLVPVLFYISHGFNKKTTAAVIGTGLTVILTAVLAKVFIESMHFSGIAIEEIQTLLYAKKGDIDLQGILVAGILMGALGVIDDVAMTQSSLVEQLMQTNPKMSYSDLVMRAMHVGRDHIGSVINTLILVYVGGSLATLLLFTEFPRPFIVLINSDIVTIPIVTALIGSIGLICAIPITTLIAVWLMKKK